MALSYWIETMLSLSNPAGSKNPGRLCKQVGVETTFPLVPPFTQAYLQTGAAVAAKTRGLPIYMMVRFRLRFGYMVSGAFSMSIVDGGVQAFTGTITGYTLEEGADYLHFVEPNTITIAYITNLTPLNQYFQLIQQYLIVTSEADYVELRRQLEKMQYPYALPEVK